MSSLCGACKSQPCAFCSDRLVVILVASRQCCSIARAVVPGAGAGQLATVGSAAEYLAQRRTWRGLEVPLTGADVLPAGTAVAGRSGRAAGYDDEPAMR